MNINEMRWVYGTRTEKWCLVDSTDRDYKTGITQDEMNKIGFEAAKTKYLSASIIQCR